MPSPTSHSEAAAIEARIERVIARRFEGAATVGEIATCVGLTPARTRTRVKAMVADGRLVELGTSISGGQCYGPVPNDSPLSATADRTEAKACSR